MSYGYNQPDNGASYDWSGSLLSYIQNLQAKAVPTTRTSSGVVYSSWNGASPYSNINLARQDKQDSFLLQIQGYQQAQQSVVALSQGDVLKQQQQLNMTLEDAARQFSQVSSSQRAAVGASGLSIHSGSFLNVFADQASQYTMQVQRAKDITKMNQESTLRAALYQSEAYNYDIKGVQKQSQLESLLIDG